MGRKCSKCGLLKDESCFYRRSRVASGRNGVCGECLRTYGKAWYEKNRESRRAGLAGHTKRRWQENRRLVFEYLSGRSCMDCGERDVVVFEFDHVRGEKTASVGFMVQRFSWAKIQAEIAKCDVVCANCHRRRTAKKFWPGNPRVEGSSPSLG